MTIYIWIQWQSMQTIKVFIITNVKCVRDSDNILSEWISELLSRCSKQYLLIVYFELHYVIWLFGMEHLFPFISKNITKNSVCLRDRMLLIQWNQTWWNPISNPADLPYTRLIETSSSRLVKRKAAVVIRNWNPIIKSLPYKCKKNPTIDCFFLLVEETLKYYAITNDTHIHKCV